MKLRKPVCGNLCLCIDSWLLVVDTVYYFSITLVGCQITRFISHGEMIYFISPSPFKG